MHPDWILAAFLATPIAGAQPALPSAPATPATSRVAGVSEVEIRTSDDLTLSGSFFAPKNQGRLAPAALVIHATGADRSQMEDISLRLQKLGFGVLSIDVRGHGKSRTSDLDWERLDEKGRKALWELAIRDVESASRWLLGQDGIHSTNLSLVGYDSGCALAARHATRDENVHCIALLSPKSEVYGFDVENDLKDLGGLPTLVMAQRDAEDATERMVQEANAIAHPYIELVFSSPKLTTVLDDKKIPAKIATWLKDTAMPKKGRG